MPTKKIFLAKSVARNRRRKPVKKAGLTMKEKSQVKAIAKKTVQTVAEKKFTDSTQYQDQPFVSGRVGGPIAVMGYSTTEDTQNEDTPINFGDELVNEGLCLKPFFTRPRAGVGSAVDTEQYAIVGKEIKPVSCHTRMRFVRKYTVLDNGQDPIPESPNPGQADGGGAPPIVINSLAENLPIQFRMVRVSPKGTAGTLLTINPNVDLFLDKYSNPISVSSGDFNENEVDFLKVNTRKYTVHEDKRWSLRNPLTLQYTFQRINNSNNGHYIPQISNTNANCEKNVNMYHQLTARKGGTVRYNTMDDGDESGNITQNPTTGMKREYVFIMAYYKGATELVGPGTGALNPRNEIKWNLYNSTQFTDV